MLVDARAGADRVPWIPLTKLLRVASVEAPPDCFGGRIPLRLPRSDWIWLFRKLSIIPWMCPTRSSRARASSSSSFLRVCAREIINSTALAASDRNLSMSAISIARRLASSSSICSRRIVCSVSSAEALRLSSSSWMRRRTESSVSCSVRRRLNSSSSS